MEASSTITVSITLGYGDGEMFIGSDAMALAPLTQQITYLEEGDWAIVTGTGVTVRDADGTAVARPIQETSLSGALTGKGGHEHFMLKACRETEGRSLAFAAKSFK